MCVCLIDLAMNLSDTKSEVLLKTLSKFACLHCYFSFCPYLILVLSADNMLLEPGYDTDGI